MKRCLDDGDAMLGLVALPRIFALFRMLLGIQWFASLIFALERERVFGMLPCKVAAQLTA